MAEGESPKVRGNVITIVVDGTAHNTHDDLRLLGDKCLRCVCVVYSCAALFSWVWLSMGSPSVSYG